MPPSRSITRYPGLVAFYLVMRHMPYIPHPFDGFLQEPGRPELDGIRRCQLEYLDRQGAALLIKHLVLDPPETVATRPPRGLPGHL